MNSSENTIDPCIGRGALLIAGPTASGKSALAVKIASRLNGCIVNADSMQVYRDLRILSARPTLEDEQSVPHKLFGFVDAARNYSVGFWLADAAHALAQIHSSGRLPIFVGGTGLYFKALIHGLSAIPAVPAAVRAAVRQNAEGISAEALHMRLKQIDPQTAFRLRPSDRQRILRALEVATATGESLTSFQCVREPPLLAPATWRGMFLSPDRQDLRTRIDSRFDTMIASGALDEARALAARSLDPELPAMRAHGVPGLLAHVRGAIGLEDAVARGKSDTRRYLKRQFTFARHQLPELQRVRPDAAEDWILRAFAE